MSEFDRYMQLVCTEYEVQPEDIIGTGRTARCTWPRQVLCYVLREVGWMLTEIGRFVGRDHSTVSNAAARVRSRIAADAEERRRVRSILRWLGPGEITTEERALQQIEAASEQITKAITDAVALLAVLEERARSIRALIANPVITRGVA